MTERSRKRTADLLARIDQALIAHGSRLAPERIRELVADRDRKKAERK